jgi:hypothetical protein
MVDHAVASFDRAARIAESKWGIDRLPELVSPELAARYGGAIAYLNEAIAESDPDKAAAAAQNCIKGISAMEAAAIEAGHQPPKATAHVDLDGWRIRIVADAGMQSAMPDDGIPTFTLREAARALQAYCQLTPIEAAKRAFPNAEITKLPPMSEQPSALSRELNDSIPF